MELENLNREYLSLKSKLRDARSKENTLNNRLTVLSDEKIIINGKLVEAKRNNDQAEIKRLNQELKQVNDDIADLKSEAVIQKEEIDGIRSMINARVNEVRNNVALQYHLDSALTTRYSRQLKKSNEEKQEILKKRNELVSLSQLLNNHRTLMNNAKGIANATKSIKKLKDELDSLKVVSGGAVTYRDQTRANEILNNLIPAANRKIQRNKKALKDYIDRKKIKINKNAIDKLETMEYKTDRTGQADVNKALDKQIDLYNKDIAKVDKKIDQYTRAYNMMPEEMRREQQNGVGVVQITPEQTENNIKWYNFIKRFKAWRERRNQAQLPDPTVREDSQEFKNSLKYDIVKDYMKTTERDDLKRAKQNQQRRGPEER